QILGRPGVRLRGGRRLSWAFRPGPSVVGLASGADRFAFRLHSTHGWRSFGRIRRRQSVPGTRPAPRCDRPESRVGGSPARHAPQIRPLPRADGRRVPHLGRPPAARGVLETTLPTGADGYAWTATVPPTTPWG